MRNLLFPFLASQQILLVEPSLQAGGLKKMNKLTNYSQIWMGEGNEYQIRFRHSIDEFNQVDSLPVLELSTSNDPVHD
jgi:hypothetical protein